MSINHVVMWHLKGETPGEKDESAQRVKGVLLPLVDSIPQIISMTLHDSVVHEARNADLILTSEFASLDDLQAYQVHPDHEAAAAVIREVTTARVVGDWITGD
ncbi:MAG: Dabb family protein [Aurantimicrobium sp.]|nr:Dabb family protein [Aurantimicrobium sp.]